MLVSEVLRLYSWLVFGFLNQFVGNLLRGRDAERFEVFESANDVARSFVELAECAGVGLLCVVKVSSYGLERFDVGYEFVVE